MDHSELEDSWAGELGSSETYSDDGLEPVRGYGTGQSLVALLRGIASKLNSRYGTGHPLITVLNVIGDDDREPVHNTRDFPWRCICALDITAGDGTKWHSTGWFIGPGTVITAGHCVYLHENKGEVAKIKIVPGRNGKDEPFESCEATEFRYPDEWKTEGERIYDYGAIILPPARRDGTKLGHLGFAKMSDESLQGLLANLCGYPDDKPAGTQWFNARRLTQITAGSLRYTIDTYEGHSGAPLWWLKDGKRYVVGIHNAGSDRTNHATRINTTVFENLKRWKAEGM